MSFRSGQLYIGDQIVCVNGIYLDSTSPTLAEHIDQLLNLTQLSIELAVISTTVDRSHVVVSSSENDRLQTLPMPFDIDMVVSLISTQ